MEDKNLYEYLTEDFVEPAANFYMTSENREMFYELWGQFKKTLAGYTRQLEPPVDKVETVAKKLRQWDIDDWYGCPQKNLSTTSKQ